MPKIVFVQNLFYEYFGLKTLSAVLRKEGHQTDVVIGYAPRLIGRRLAAKKPDVVGIYYATGDDDFVNGVAAALKRRGFSGPVIVGGPHPTLCPEVVTNRDLDFACVGEGDIALSEFMGVIPRGKAAAKGLGNFAYLEDGRVITPPLHSLVKDLGALPHPDENLYAGYRHIYKSSVKFFIGSRGCPYSCTFCCNQFFKELYAGRGPYYRKTPPEKLIEEILRVRAANPFRAAAFMDDDFLASRDWANSFLELYREQVATPFSCLIRIDRLDLELAKELKRAGCHMVIFGVEAGEEAYRNKILKKNLSDARIKNGAELLRRAGLDFATVNMLGLPTETRLQTLKTVKLNQEVNPKLAFSHLYQPLPKTELGEYAVRTGCVSREDMVDIPSTTMNTSILSQPDIRFSINIHYFFHLLVKFPRLLPLIKPLCDAPANMLFKLIHRLTYFYLHKTYFRKTFLETFLFGLYSLLGLRFTPVKNKNRRV